MKKEYVVRVKRGSTDEVRVKKCLDDLGVKYYESTGVLETIFIHFEANKETWKQIKKDLGLSIESVYCTFKELV